MALTEQGREKIREAQRLRWAKYYERTPTCSNGHPWTEENTRRSPSPSRSNGVSGRACRTCEREKKRKK